MANNAVSNNDPIIGKYQFGEVFEGEDPNYITVKRTSDGIPYIYGPNHNTFLTDEMLVEDSKFKPNEEFKAVYQ